MASRSPKDTGNIRNAHACIGVYKDVCPRTAETPVGDSQKGSTVYKRRSHEGAMRIIMSDVARDGNKERKYTTHMQKFGETHGHPNRLTKGD